MAPETTNGRLSSPQAPADQTDPDAAKQSQVSVILPRGTICAVRATVAAPSGRRGHWLVLVSRCVQCAEPHVHRARDGQALLAGDVVRGCPVTHAPYRLVPVRVVVDGQTVRGAAS